MPRHDELLDIKQAASFLNVSETSLRRWTNAGRLPCLRVGHRRERRFRRTDLLAFMEVESSQLDHHDEIVSLAAQATSIGGVAVPHGAHLFGFYDTESGRSALATTFLSGSLQRRHACLVLSSPAARASIMQRLRRSHPSVDLDVASGRLKLADFRRTVGEQYEFLESHLSGELNSGFASLRLVDDVWAFAQAIGVDGLVEFESAFDHRIAERFPIVTLCLYDVRKFSGPQLLGALKVHHDAFRYPAQWSLS